MEIYLIGSNKDYYITQLSWLLEEKGDKVHSFDNLTVAIKHIEDDDIKTNIIFVFISDVDTHILNKIINNNKYGFVFTIGGFNTDYILEIIDKVKTEVQFRNENSIEDAVIEWITIEKKRIKMGLKEDTFLMRVGRQTFTLTDILHAIQNKTQDGYEFINGVIMLTIDLVLRGKREIK